MASATAQLLRSIRARSHSLLFLMRMYQLVPASLGDVGRLHICMLMGGREGTSSIVAAFGWT